MYEFPSWNDPEKEPAWYEYLMWEPDRYTGLPIKYLYKYYDSKEVDAEIKRRAEWANRREDGIHGN